MPKWSAQAPEQTALYAQIRASRQPCSASEPPATTARARGDYATALTYLEQSLAISREIGDARGLCATLFNTSHIYAQNEQIEEALRSAAAADLSPLAGLSNLTSLGLGEHSTRQAVALLRPLPRRRGLALFEINNVFFFSSMSRDELERNSRKVTYLPGRG